MDEQYEQRFAQLETFDFIDHMDDFEKENIALNCPTKELYNELMQFLEKQGYHWATSDKPTQLNYWTPEHCYTGRRKSLGYSSISLFYDTSKKVLVFKGVD